MRTLALFSAALATLLLVWACGDTGGTNPLPGGCDPACGEGTVCKNGKCVTETRLDGGSGDGGDIIIPPRPDAGTPPKTPDAGPTHCAAETTRAQQLPLDIYIMLDQSLSMGTSTTSSKWLSVTAAIESFISQPLANVSVGIQYFSLPPGGITGYCAVKKCTTSADCGTGCGTCSATGECSGYNLGSADDSCNTADYAKPDVEIAPLPGVASAIKASIKRHWPWSLTPTSAALQGAIDHCKAWGNSHPQHVVIDILATDGEPTDCDTSISAIEAIARAGVNGTPKVLTFVIGVGTSRTNMDKIAAAGGTTAAFVVDSSSNVNQQFLDALNRIRGAALGCTYKIPLPTTGTPDFNKVNLQYTKGGTTTPVIIPQVSSKTACPVGKDAWYYDVPAAPTTIILCDSTCDKVKADSTGTVDVLLGCTTIIN